MKSIRYGVDESTNVPLILDPSPIDSLQFKKAIKSPIHMFRLWHPDNQSLESALFKTIFTEPKDLRGSTVLSIEIHRAYALFLIGGAADSIAIHLDGRRITISDFDARLWRWAVRSFRDSLPMLSFLPDLNEIHNIIRIT